MSSPAFNGNIVTLTYTIKIGFITQDFLPDLALLSFFYLFSKILKNIQIIFSDETIRDMQFVVNTAPSCLIPMLDAIDRHMLDRENKDHFEILKLQADSPNCTFST